MGESIKICENIFDFLGGAYKNFLRKYLNNVLDSIYALWRRSLIAMKSESKDTAINRIPALKMEK